ncbi:hypothetical protein [uncultured Gilvimarinus sp.]|uniref:hypothetical protein n=1 Tax=uncultured Gilvimarinus sp. TaxID=1689143 RepID=UPI0030D8CA9B
MEIKKIAEGPIKRSTNSVFETLNKKTESLDILQKYKRANESLVRSNVENVQILGMTQPVKLEEIYSIPKVSVIPPF